MTMRTTIMNAPLMLSLCVLSAGCGAGQTGDLSGNHDETGNGTGVSGGCDDHVQRVALDDAAELGFSAARILAFAARSFDTPVSWQAVEGVHYTPDAGHSTLTLTLGAAGAPAFVRSTPHASAEESGATLAVICPPDRLRIPVHAELSTADGALLESFDSRLEASDPAFARLDQALNASTLTGAFTVDSIDSSVLFPGIGGPAELGPLTLGATLSEAGMAGSLAAQISAKGKAVSGATNVLLAQFPADASCPAAPGDPWSIPVTAEDPTIGLSGRQAVEDVNAQGPFPLQWSNGSKTSVSVRISGLSTGCLQGPALGAAERAAPTAAYPVMVVLSTADRVFAGSYSTRLIVERSAGGGYSRHLEVHREYASSEVDQTGFSATEIPSGTQRSSVGIQMRVSEQDASGSLVLNGLSDPPCLTTPPPATGNSVPGCAGTTVTPLLTGTWASPSIQH